jgi:hypothetical protein
MHFFLLIGLTSFLSLVPAHVGQRKLITYRKKFEVTKYVSLLVMASVSLSIFCFVWRCQAQSAGRQIHDAINVASGDEPSLFSTARGTRIDDEDWIPPAFGITPGPRVTSGVSGSAKFSASSSSSNPKANRYPTAAQQTPPQLGSSTAVEIIAWREQLSKMASGPSAECIAESISRLPEVCYPMDPQPTLPIFLGSSAHRGVKERLRDGAAAQLGIKERSRDGLGVENGVKEVQRVRYGVGAQSGFKERWGDGVGSPSYGYWSDSLISPSTIPVAHGRTAAPMNVRYWSVHDAPEFLRHLFTDDSMRIDKLCNWDWAANSCHLDAFLECLFWVAVHFHDSSFFLKVKMFFINPKNLASCNSFISRSSC